MPDTRYRMVNKTDLGLHFAESKYLKEETDNKPETDKKPK